MPNKRTPYLGSCEIRINMLSAWVETASNLFCEVSDGLLGVRVSVPWSSWFVENRILLFPILLPLERGVPSGLWFYCKNSDWAIRCNPQSLQALQQVLNHTLSLVWGVYSSHPQPENSGQLFEPGDLVWILSHHPLILETWWEAPFSIITKMPIAVKVSGKWHWFYSTQEPGGQGAI